MKYLLIFTFLFLYNITNGQICENLKIGFFKTKVKDVECIINRTEKKEIIKSKYGTVKFKIKWISNCKYILFKRKPKLKIIYGDLKLDDFDENRDTLFYEVTENNEREFKVVALDKNPKYNIEYVYKKK